MAAPRPFAEATGGGNEGFASRLPQMRQTQVPSRNAKHFRNHLYWEGVSRVLFLRVRPRGRFGGVNRIARCFQKYVFFPLHEPAQWCTILAVGCCMQLDMVRPA